MQNMTELTRKMYARAAAPMSVPEALSVLREHGQFRALADILRSHAGDHDPKALLTQGLSANHPQLSRDTAARRVRNWFNGSIRTISKKDAFEVCQILGLTLEEADDFVMQVTGEAIHWRDPEEIIWCYAIVHRLDFPHTCALLARGEELNIASKAAPPPAPGSFTGEVKEKLMPVLHRSEEELFDFLHRSRSALGTYHNTAYRLFMQYLELLETGSIGDGLEDSPKMTSREILESYMYRRIVPVSKQKGSKPAFTGVQQSIRMNWPDESTLSKMKSRELDIPRKVLILLFLATDGSASEFEEEDEDEDILTRDEVFQNIYTRLNRMLHACGFQTLDPRNPFDWMVLYCICVDDIWDTDQRLRDMLQGLFPDGNGNQ